MASIEDRQTGTENRGRLPVSIEFRAHGFPEFSIWSQYPLLIPPTGSGRSTGESHARLAAGCASERP